MQERHFCRDMSFADGGETDLIKYSLLSDEEPNDRKGHNYASDDASLRHVRNHTFVPTQAAHVPTKYAIASGGSGNPREGERLEKISAITG